MGVATVGLKTWITRNLSGEPQWHREWVAAEAQRNAVRDAVLEQQSANLFAMYGENEAFAALQRRQQAEQEAAERAAAALEQERQQAIADRKAELQRNHEWALKIMAADRGSVLRVREKLESYMQDDGWFSAGEGA